VVRKTAFALFMLCLLTVMTAFSPQACAEDFERTQVWLSLDEPSARCLKMPDPFSPWDMFSGEHQWSSSDESVVTVSSGGVLTAQSEGTAVISCGFSWNRVSCQVTVGSELDTLMLPASLTTVGESAFENVVSAQRIVLPSGLEQIKSRAFAGNTGLLCIEIPQSVTDIAPDAFDGCANLSFLCPRGSAAEAYAKEHGIPCLSARPAVPAESIRFGIGGVPLSVGSSYQLHAAITPENASHSSVVWNTTNANIAAVEDGLVTGVSAGYAYVWAESADGFARKACYFQISNVAIKSITLPEKLPITLGQTCRMQPEILPANATFQTLAWQSSQPTVVSVDEDGVITANALGTAVITASATDGSGCTASCEVTVSASPIAVSSVWCSEAALSINKGTTHQLTAGVVPVTAENTEILWTTSDLWVAKVDSNGLVSARSEGEAVIRAISAANETIYAECSVTVLPPIKVTSVACNEHPVLLAVGESRQLTATVLPENAYDRSVVWSTSDTDIVTLTESGYVTAVGTGTAVVVARAADGSGRSDVCYVEVCQPGTVTHPQNHHACLLLRPIDHLEFDGVVHVPQHYASIIDQFNVTYGANDASVMGWYEYWASVDPGLSASGFAANVSYAMGCFMPLEFCCGRCGLPISASAFQTCDSTYLYTGGYMWQGIQRIGWYCTCANRYTVSTWTMPWIYEWFTGEGDNLNDDSVSYSFGWTECSAETAVQTANMGRLTIGLNEEHIFLVHPGDSAGMYISQGGEELLSNAPMPYDPADYRYYYCTGAY